MSFSSKVKSELSVHFGNARHCNVAEISAIINMCGEIIVNKDKFCIKIQTENARVARKYFTLIKKTFNIDNEIVIRKNRQLKKNRVYTLVLKSPSESVKNVLLATGILRNGKEGLVLNNTIYPLVVSSTCCKRAYIRGAFLASGSISDPEKTYHLEFVSTNEEYSLSLRELINSFGLDSKVVKRKDHYITYIKEGEQIVDILNIMEAFISLMELENVRIIKDMRNSVNRKVNCETANLNKTITASIKQVEEIELIKKIVGLNKLPRALRDIASLRLEYPEASLKELGEMMEPPVGKSGVNHRLRKISEIADSLREGKVISNE